ncbi:MAG TPA: zinc ABC transporter substrate-binding protein [Mycobacteriales bacterium]|nr:zinc ABC transporter substrate-binding protein [Mycobacteriales bacterium]
MIRGAATAVMAALLVSVVAGCGSAGPSGSGGYGGTGRIDVVAAENFWGNIAQQIGGRHVQVTSIISDPNTDPHVYQSDPQDAAEISNAQLVIENGLGYDDFIDKILATGGRPGRRVLSVQKVLDITGSNPNPHVWYWTARLPQVAAAIAAQLSAIDPKDAGDFTAGAKRFDASLRPLVAIIAEIKKKYAGTEISYTERVPGYLVQAAGLVLGTPASFSLAIEDGNDPSPQDTETFDADITGHKVKVLLYNSQVVDAQTTKIKQLATSAGIPIVGVSETLPPSYSDFQAWQLAQDRELLQALGG